MDPVSALLAFTATLAVARQDAIQSDGRPSPWERFLDKRTPSTYPGLAAKNLVALDKMMEAGRPPPRWRLLVLFGRIAEDDDVYIERIMRRDAGISTPSANVPFEILIEREGASRAMIRQICMELMERNVGSLERSQARVPDLRDLLEIKMSFPVHHVWDAERGVYYLLGELSALALGPNLSVFPTVAEAAYRDRNIPGFDRYEILEREAERLMRTAPEGVHQMMILLLLMYGWGPWLSSAAGHFIPLAYQPPCPLADRPADNPWQVLKQDNFLLGEGHMRVASSIVEGADGDVFECGAGYDE